MPAPSVTCHCRFLGFPFSKELLIRGDLDRCLIVAPGSLVEQWQEAHRRGDLIRTQLLPQSQARDRRFDLVARDDVEAERELLGHLRCYGPVLRLRPEPRRSWAVSHTRWIPVAALR